MLSLLTYEQQILKKRIIDGIEFCKNNPKGIDLLNDLKSKWLNIEEANKPKQIFLAFWREDEYNEYLKKLYELEIINKTSQEDCLKLEKYIIKLIDRLSELYNFLKKI